MARNADQVASQSALACDGCQLQVLRHRPWQRQRTAPVPGPGCVLLLEHDRDQTGAWAVLLAVPGNFAVPLLHLASSAARWRADGSRSRTSAYHGSHCSRFSRSSSFGPNRGCDTAHCRVVTAVTKPGSRSPPPQGHPHLSLPHPATWCCIISRTLDLLVRVPCVMWRN